MMNGRVLKPFEYCGDYHGDYGYEIDGVKSERSYASYEAARAALQRAMWVDCSVCGNPEYRNEATKVGRKWQCASCSKNN